MQFFIWALNYYKHRPLFFLKENGRVSEIMTIVVPNIGHIFVHFAEESGKMRCHLDSPQRQTSVEYIERRVRFAWNLAAHPHDIMFRIYSPYFQASYNAISVSHVTGHLCARPNAGLFATRSDVSRTPMCFGNTVRGWHPFEAPSFHYALKATIDSVNLHLKGVKNHFTYSSGYIHCAYVLPRTSTTSPTRKCVTFNGVPDNDETMNILNWINSLWSYENTDLLAIQHRAL